MEESDVDYNKLIQEVNKYRSLWNQKSLDYQNRTLKIKDWTMVALEMDLSVDDVKSRWKRLEDTFFQELRSSAKSGQPSKWSYFESMSFLLQGYNNLLLPSAYISRSHTELDSGYTSSISCDNELSENSSVTGSQRKKVKFNPRNEPELLTSTPYQCSPQIQSNELCHESNSEDYYFLLSLLPSFERMHAKQKMVLKIKIMQDVYNAAYGEPSVPNLSFNTSSAIDSGLTEFTPDS